MGAQAPSGEAATASRSRRSGFPPRAAGGCWRPRRQSLFLRTSVGDVELQVWYGYDPTAQRWGCPMRQRWALEPYQRISPSLQDKILFTVTATGTYEQAAAVVSKWGCPMDDSTVHRLVQQLGARAEGQTVARLKTVPQELAPPKPPSALAVVMLDGFLVRFRGPAWNKEQEGQPAVEWHEMKTGVFYTLEQASKSQS